MQLYGTRVLLTLLVLGMAVFIGYRVFDHMHTRSQGTTTVTLEEQQGADAWIQGFTYRQTRSGSTKWVVDANQAKVFDKEHIAKLQTVQVRLFDGEFQNEQLQITSEEGVMNTSSNDFELVSKNKKTVMTFEAGYQVFSDKLTWNEKARQIHTTDRVTIKGDGLIITGTGLEGDVDNNEFHLLRNVRAEVVSP
ncbi:MAG TPA: LPS export ABC transporter periplasmic protein LptC [Nitrospirales bacterium]|nr:LPS export ABC transporter periplasmic protein LptC [Nitrospiraceae bacterium]HNP28879.1 LPS export ABC transporter periplasmic protein LptC [Nitrospirales bacterium]